MDTNVATARGPGAMLWLVTTRLCQFACRYCYQTDHAPSGIRAKGLTRTMSEDTMERTLDWALKWSGDSLRVAWFGGEPLLTFNIMERWAGVWKMWFDLAGKTLTQGVTTNGQLLTPKVRDFLDEHDIGCMVSLDGPEYLHNKNRVLRSGKGTWDRIPVEDIIKWRPNIEAAWQLDPNVDFSPIDLDRFMDLGFHRVNFNIDWTHPWDTRALDRLRTFMQYVGKLAIQGRHGGSWVGVRGKRTKVQFGSNWLKKLDKVLTMKRRLERPCGTGLHMVGVTPEGWIYPSQEMAFTVFGEGLAPGTPEYYKLGDVKNGGIDPEKLEILSAIRVDQIQPKPFTTEDREPFAVRCNQCIARFACVGGCHCRYVGQDGRDPAYRYDVPLSHCLTIGAAMEGMLKAAQIEGYQGEKHGMECKRTGGK